VSGVIQVLLCPSFADDPCRSDRRSSVSRDAFEARADAVKDSGRLALPVHLLAYPHGAFDRRVREAVIEADYRSAAAAKNAVSHAAGDSYAIGRWTVTEGPLAAQIAPPNRGWAG
jgi:hypothetical protein